MSGITRAFSLALNGSEGELQAMLSSGEVQASAAQTTGMYRGYSLLHAAAAKGQGRCADLLLRAGASPRARNAQGKTPAQLAADKGHAAVAALLQAAEAGQPQPAPPQPAAVAPMPSFSSAAVAAPPHFAAALPPAVGAHGASGSMHATAPRSCAAAGFWAAESTSAQMAAHGGVDSQMDAHSYAALPASHVQPTVLPPPQPVAPVMSAFVPPPNPMPHPAFAPPPQPLQPPMAPPVPPVAAAAQPPPMQAAPAPHLPPPSAPTMRFAPPSQPAPAPPIAPPAAPTATDDGLAARVEALLNAHAGKVASGSFLAVIPHRALPTLIGDGQAKIQESCARTGAQVPRATRPHSRARRAPQPALPLPAALASRCPDPARCLRLPPP